MASNYETALKAEQARCVRGWQPYTAEQRTNQAASRRLGRLQRAVVGKPFWTHPDIAEVCFPTRISAARAALTA